MGHSKPTQPEMEVIISEFKEKLCDVEYIIETKLTDFCLLRYKVEINAIKLINLAHIQNTYLILTRTNCP